MPADIPVTIPLVAPIEPTDGLLLVHVPPGEPSERLVVEPMHALIVPDIGSMPFTVIIAVA